MHTKSIRLFFGAILSCVSFWDVGSLKGDGIQIKADLPTAAIRLPVAVSENPVLFSELQLAMAQLKAEGKYDDAVLRVATMYHANGYEQEAESLYLWLVDRSRSDEEAARIYYRLAHLVKEKGDSEQANDYLKSAAATGVNYPLLYYMLGESSYKQHELEQSTVYFEKALSLDESFAPALLGLARVDLARDDIESASQRLEAVLRFDGDNYNAKAMLAGIFQRKGEAREAYELRKSITHSSAAPLSDPWLVPVNEAIYDPQRLDFLFLDYFMVGEEESALRYLERMEAVDPENARNFRYRGLYHMELKELETAERFLRRGTEFGNCDYEMYQLLVRCLRQQENPAEAEQIAREGLVRFPGNSELKLELARLLFASGEADAAESVLGEALLVDPYSIEAHLLYARILSLAGDQAKAEQSFSKVLQLAPSDAEVLVRAALAHMESSNFTDALVFLQRARSVAPFYKEALELVADAYFELGQVAYASGETEEAIELLSQGLEANATHVGAQTLLVRCFLKMGRTDEAEISMRDFLGRAGPHPMYLLMYGDLLARSGKVSAAKEIWNRALISLNGDVGSQHLRESLLQRLGR